MQKIPQSIARKTGPLKAVLEKALAANPEASVNLYSAVVAMRHALANPKNSDTLTRLAGLFTDSAYDLLMADHDVSEVYGADGLQDILLYGVLSQLPAEAAMYAPRVVGFRKLWPGMKTVAMIRGGELSYTYVPEEDSAIQPFKNYSYRLLHGLSLADVGRAQGSGYWENAKDFKDTVYPIITGLRDKLGRRPKVDELREAIAELKRIYSMAPQGDNISECYPPQTLGAHCRDYVGMSPRQMIEAVLSPRGD
jgi:hypothetical protein